MYFCHILPNCQFYVFLFHSYMIKGQGHLKVKVKAVQYQGQLLKINFRCLIVNIFVICVLRGWYPFDWKAFLFLIKTSPVQRESIIMFPLFPKRTTFIVSCGRERWTVCLWFKISLKQESPPAWTQEAYRPPRGKHTLCCSGGGRGGTYSGGGYLPWLGGTYPGGGYLPWWGGGTYPRWEGTYPRWGVPTLGGGYLP